MMNRKLLTTLGVLLVVLGALSWVTKKGRYSAVEGGGFEELLAEPLDGAAIETVRAWLGSAPDSSVELTRSGEGWVVSSAHGWPAKTDLVDRLLDDLSGMKGELRSSSADVLADYQIDEDAGVHVVGSGSGGSELFHVIVGKTATRGGSFVRRHDSNDVFLTGAALRSSFGVWGDDPKPPEPKRWLELRVHRAERTDVDRIVLSSGGSVIQLAKVFTEGEPDSAGVVPPIDRSQWTWQDGDGKELDKQKADGILGTVCNLYASDVVEPSDDANAYGFGENARTVEVFLQDGSATTLYFGESTEEDSKTYGRVGEDGLPALIYKSTVDRLFPDRSELEPAAAE